MKIGVLGIQGDVSEHVSAASNALQFYGVKGEVITVRKKEVLKDLDYLIIPGGESTTISRLMIRSGIYDEILRRVDEGMGVIGTCAGSILMAKEVVDDDRVTPLKLMDISVRRNFFGRQRESFETELEIKYLGKYHAVFIRAPVIEKCWGDCEVLATIGDNIAMARQEKHFALIFHPELTEDYRIYRLFLNLRE